MAINVTLGEAKTKKPKSKPFPKLMIGNIGTIIEVLEKPSKTGVCPVVHRTGGYKGSFATSFNLTGGVEQFTDYNEPITIQNA